MCGDKTAPSLLLCPFCGERPRFTTAEHKDGRRYVEMLLQCCSIEMSETLSFGQHKAMTDDQIIVDLRSKLIRKWNTRAAPAPQCEPELICDCQQPEEINGLRLISNSCPVHNENPDPPPPPWPEVVAAHSRSDARTEAVELRGALEFLLQTKWKSVEKDNMEFEGRVTCYQLERARAAIATHKGDGTTAATQCGVNLATGERDNEETDPAYFKPAHSQCGVQCRDALQNIVAAWDVFEAEELQLDEGVEQAIEAGRVALALPSADRGSK